MTGDEGSWSVVAVTASPRRIHVHRDGVLLPFESKSSPGFDADLDRGRTQIGESLDDLVAQRSELGEDARHRGPIERGDARRDASSRCSDVRIPHAEKVAGARGTTIVPMSSSVAVEAANRPPPPPYA